MCAKRQRISILLAVVKSRFLRILPLLLTALWISRVVKHIFSDNQNSFKGVTSSVLQKLHTYAVIHYCKNYKIEIIMLYSVLRLHGREPRNIYSKQEEKTPSEQALPYTTLSNKIPVFFYNRYILSSLFQLKNCHCLVLYICKFD